MVDYFPDSHLIFCDRIWLITDTVFLISESHTAKTVVTREALFAVEEIS